MIGKETKNTKEREKKTGFNIIDLIILLFVVLAVIGIIMRYNLADKINLRANGTKFEIEFMIENIQEASQDYLKAGETFYLRADDTEIGKIKEILDIRRDAVTYVQDMYGNITKSELPTRIDVTGVMTCTGRKSDEGYYLNGNSFAAPGKQYSVHTGKLSVDITIMSIKIVD